MSETSPEEAVREFERQRRLVDQTITMQATLRDWNSAAGVVLTSVILVASLVGVAFAFAVNSQELKFLGVVAERTTWLGWLAVVTAALTTIDLLIDRRGAARSRDDAVSRLSDLKGEYRVELLPGSEVAEMERIGAKYSATMTAVPPVPEPLFNRLKAAHLRKVEISKILSQSPGISVRGAKRVLRKRLK